MRETQTYPLRLPRSLKEAVVASTVQAAPEAKYSASKPVNWLPSVIGVPPASMPLSSNVSL